MKPKWTKTLAAVLAAAMLLPSTIANAKSVGDYTDVPVGAWFYDSVADVSAKELMTGLNETTFGPAETLGRAQFATVLYRMAGSPEVAYDAKFPDVPDGQFYSIPITWASSIGVVTGYDDTGLFGTTDPINREQMATMLYRYANQLGLDTSARADYTVFPDGSNVNAFASEAMQWAVGTSLITGNGDGTLAPQDHVNRAVCATMISRFTGPAESPEPLPPLTGYSGDFMTVGEDLPAGEYIVLSTTDLDGYFCVSSPSDYSIIYNDLFAYNSIFTVYDGEYLDVSRAMAFPLEQWCAQSSLDLTKPGGMYKIGVNLPAGEYRLIAASDGNASYCIYADGRHQDVIASGIFKGESSVTVSNGQYLKLSGCVISQ